MGHKDGEVWDDRKPNRLTYSKAQLEDSGQERQEMETTCGEHGETQLILKYQLVKVKSVNMTKIKNTNVLLESLILGS